MLNLEKKKWFSTLLSKFFRKVGKMLLTGNAQAIKTKSLFMYNSSDVGICLMLLCKRGYTLEISLNYER